MRIEPSIDIDRSPETVFRFVAVDHVRNHPRWDPMMELEQLSPGSVGVGTIIKRRHTHGGVPVEGIMEIVEFEPDEVMAVMIHDGPIEISSHMTLHALGPQGTKLTITVEIPGMQAPMDPSPVEGSLRRIKELIESET